MPDDNLDRLAFDAFLLAMRVMYRVHDIEAPATEFEKPFAMLREIVDGELTLASPAEIGARHPNLTDLVHEQANRVVEHDREVARRVLTGLAGAF